MLKLRNATLSLMIICLTIISVLPQVAAHVPLSPSDNESLTRALTITDPTKSWAIYAELHEGGEAQYYRFDITQGERIHLALLTSTDASDQGFLPSFALMGPALMSQGVVPTYVEVPQGAIASVTLGSQLTVSTYEAFGPSSYNSVAEVALEAPATGIYYVAVFDDSRGGHYSLVVGDRESFTIQEWLLNPINVINVYQWEGQSLAVIFAPMLVTLVLGVGFLLQRNQGQKTPRTVLEWLAAVAGVLFIGSSFSILFQMLFSLMRAPLVPEIGITLLLASMPGLLGVLTLRIALRGTRNISSRTRVYLALYGFLALFVWGGLIIGSALALVASVVPPGLMRSRPFALE